MVISVTRPRIRCILHSSSISESIMTSLPTTATDFSIIPFEYFCAKEGSDARTRINARMWRLCNLIILIIVFFQFSVVKSIFEQFLFQRAQNLLFPAAYYDVSDGI